MNFSDYLALRRLAYKYAVSQSLEAEIEKAYRHYSRTYNTPLETARALPMEEALLIYFQDELEEATAEDLERIKEELFTDESLYIPKASQAKVDDDTWIAEQEKALKAQEAAKLMSETEKALKALTESMKSE